jgi:hypothetical protein
MQMIIFGPLFNLSDFKLHCGNFLFFYRNHLSESFALELFCLGIFVSLMNLLPECLNLLKLSLGRKWGLQTFAWIPSCLYMAAVRSDLHHLRIPYRSISVEQQLAHLINLRVNGLIKIWRFATNFIKNWEVDVGWGPWFRFKHCQLILKLP